MKVRSPSQLALAFVAFLAVANEGHAEGAAKHGRVLAEHLCAQCHIVVPGQKTANADVPSFMAIARKYESKPDTLRAFLIEPHQPMPDLGLNRQEILDLIAYIQSL